MKTLLLTLLFLLPSLAHAQTPVSKEMANSYFSNCVAQPSEEQFSTNAQKMFCACTAARLTQFFSVEDMQTMTSETPRAREALNKMIINIYAPCMEEPTREYHYNSCIKNPQTAALGNPDALCKCASHAIARHMQYHGPEVFQELLTRNPTMADPMQALYDDPKFQQFAQSQLLQCLK